MYYGGGPKGPFIYNSITSKLLIAFYKHDISLRKTHSK